MLEISANNGQNMYPLLDNEIQFRLNEINKIKYYFIAEICEREKASKTLSKYIAALFILTNIYLQQVQVFLLLHFLLLLVHQLE